MKQVIFVDDETNVLSGLKRMLRPMRHEWNMSFYCHGQDALNHMAETPCDVLVSDMRMPGMDGVKLLSEVKSHHPETIRIALSGQCDTNMIYQCIHNAHQYLAKPCNAKQLTEVVSRTSRLKELISDSSLRKRLTNLSGLPSLPQAYEQITDELKKNNASIENICSIVCRDIAMSAKMLHLVNSSFFSESLPATTATQAVRTLGVDVVKNLVLTNQLFLPFDEATIEKAALDVELEISCQTGVLAKKIALNETNDKLLAEHAMIAGFLSRIGSFVLAMDRADDVKNMNQLAITEHIPIWQIEERLLGFSYPRIGAYLIALWGLPDPVVQAVAFQHTPSDSTNREFSPLSAVHVATGLLTQLKNNVNQLDQNFLSQKELSANLTKYQDFASQISTKTPNAAEVA